MNKLKLLLPSLVALVAGCTSANVKEVHWVAPDGFAVTATEYASANKDADTVIILPPTGGSTYIERHYAQRLCDRGQRVLLVQEWTGLYESSTDLEIHNRLFSYAHRAVGMALEHATGRRKLLGTSLGALYGLSALARFTEIQRAVLIVGGYSFTEVIAHSQYPSMKALREERQKIFNFQSDEAYQAKLDTVFKWNDSAANLDRVNILLFQGTQDDIVPTSAQIHLAQRLPNARVVKLDHSHVWTIIDTFLFHEDEVVDQLAK